MTEPKCKTCRDSHPFCSACGSPDFVGFPELTPPPASDVEGLLAEAREQAGVAGSFRELINNLADALGQMSAEQSRLYAYFEQKRDERNEFAERVRTAETALRDAEDARVERERNVKVALDTGAKALERVTADLDRERAARVKAERNEAACRAALEEIGYTGALPEGAYDKLVRERDEALAELAGLGPVELEVNGGEGWGACTESTFNRLSEKGWMKRRVRVVKEHPNA